MGRDNEAPQTGVFKNDSITLWVLTPSTRNNCCEFLAFYDVNTQSVIESP